MSALQAFLTSQLLQSMPASTDVEIIEDNAACGYSQSGTKMKLIVSSQGVSSRRQRGNGSRSHQRAEAGHGRGERVRRLQQQGDPPSRWESIPTTKKKIPRQDVVNDDQLPQPDQAPVLPTRAKACRDNDHDDDDGVESPRRPRRRPSSTRNMVAASAS